MVGKSLELSVSYNCGKKVAGSSWRANFSDGNVGLVSTFVDEYDAVTYFHTFVNKHLSNVCNVILLDLPNRAVLVEMDEEFDLFKPSQKMEFNIWALSSDSMTIVSMSHAFVKLFKGIISGLRALYRNNWYHGNLLKGVAVSKRLDVRLFNVGEQKLTIGDGIKKDLKDLKKLVEKVINNNKHPHFPEPDLVTLFLSSYDLFKNITIHRTIPVQAHDFFAYFVFNNPIFADKEDRVILIKKFMYLRMLFERTVDEAFRFKTSPTDMGSWWLRVPVDKTFLKARLNGMQLFMFQRSRTYPPKSIAAYYRDCFFHKDEAKKAHLTNIEEFAVESSLSEIFPDFLPKAYYEFVRQLANTPFPNRSLYPSYIAYFQEAFPKIA